MSIIWTILMDLSLAFCPEIYAGRDPPGSSLRQPSESRGRSWRLTAAR
jgi:hypothetical protein